MQSKKRTSNQNDRINGNMNNGMKKQKTIIVLKHTNPIISKWCIRHKGHKLSECMEVIQLHIIKKNSFQNNDFSSITRDKID